MTITVGSLCSGLEATSLSLTHAKVDHHLAFLADNDPAAATVLAHHHAHVPNLGNISTVNWDGVERVDLLHMGFPCTDVSAAGRRAGLAHGTRSGVWAHCRQAITALRPALVLIENVPGLLSTWANRSTNGPDSDVEPAPAMLGNQPNRSDLRAAGAVLGDLASIGFDAIWATVSAASVGAPHLRNRIFILCWQSSAETETAELLTRLRRPAVPAHPGLTSPVLLPTPRTSDTNGAGAHGDGGPDLRTAVTLLPTPAARDGKSGESNILDRNARPLNEIIVNLLPTPRATDGTKGGPSQRGSSGDLMLPSAVTQLLPTPTAVHWARNATANRTNPKPDTNTDGWTLSDIAHADRWGDYAPAIRRWEQVTGRPAPDPTEPGKSGQPRLAPRFVEWMQGLPHGYVTDVPGISRNDALRLLGNTNPPQQYAAAWQHLTGIASLVLTEETAA